VQWLYVPPLARKLGVARALLARFEEMATAAGAHKAMLWTEIAEAYYHRLGWTTEAKLKNHWWGQDFAILVKPLNDKSAPH
jgi:GNAT superfamily N-acetyltransferase